MRQKRASNWIALGAAAAVLLAWAPGALASCEYDIPPCGAQLGTSGNDTLYGTSFSDCINGIGGDDILYGFDSRDFLDGGDGDDTLWGGNAGDLLDGSAGNDSLNGEGGPDDLWGGTGADVLSGNTDSDDLCGESGGDKLWGGNNPVGHSDYLDGGSESDQCREGEIVVNCET